MVKSNSNVPATGPAPIGSRVASALDPVAFIPSSTYRYWRLMLLALIGVLAAAAISLGYLLYSEYLQDRKQAAITSINLAQTLTTRLDSTFRNIDAILDQMSAEAGPDVMQDSNVPALGTAVNDRLAHRISRFPEIARLTIFNARGDLLYASDGSRAFAINVSDRDYFKKIRGDPKAGTVISDVQVAKIGGIQTVAVVRGLRDADGHFLGEIAALVNLKTFEDLFKSLNIGPHGI